MKYLIAYEAQDSTQFDMGQDVDVLLSIDPDATCVFGSVWIAESDMSATAIVEKISRTLIEGDKLIVTEIANAKIWGLDAGESEWIKEHYFGGSGNNITDMET